MFLRRDWRVDKEAKCTSCVAVLWFEGTDAPFCFPKAGLGYLD